MNEIEAVANRSEIEHHPVVQQFSGQTIFRRGKEEIGRGCKDQQGRAGNDRRIGFVELIGSKLEVPGSLSQFETRSQGISSKLEVR